MPDLYILSEIPSPLGPISLLTKGDIIHICEFADRQARVTQQLDRFYAQEHVEQGPAPISIAKAFAAYFTGDLTALDTITCAPMGTKHEQTVWLALRAIPAGHTASYGDLARKLGSSPRAVGRANGRNPACLLMPCHRVIGADGSLTGYAGGLDRKEWLLKHEGALLT